MKKLDIDTKHQSLIMEVLQKSELFGVLSEDSLKKIIGMVELIEYDSGEYVIKENDKSDAFYIIIEGEVVVFHTKEIMELVKLGKGVQFGDMGLLLDEPRTASVKTNKVSKILKINKSIFDYLLKNLPTFALSISRFLAKRVKQLSSKISLPHFDGEIESSGKKLLKLFPLDYLIRHRFIPLSLKNNTVNLGFVNDPTPSVMSNLKNTLTGYDLRAYRIDSEFFEVVIKSVSGLMEEEAKKIQYEEKRSEKLDKLLERVVQEGASAIHISSGDTPYWRIDDELIKLEDSKKFQIKDIKDLIEPLLTPEQKNELNSGRELNLTYSFSDKTRFLINVFYNFKGLSLVVKVINSIPKTLEQLKVPEEIKEMIKAKRGIIFVSGTAGSGKTTTIAAILDFINNNYKKHIITIENPVEYIIKSKKSLVNQIEIKDEFEEHIKVLKSVFKDDPDVIFTGSLRTLEHFELAFELAQTGHLVLANMNAINTIDTLEKIIEIFPDNKKDFVKSRIGDSLIGVLTQSLCKKIGGGSIAVFELLRTTPHIINLIKKEEFIEIKTLMRKDKFKPHTNLDEELVKLLKENVIDKKEAKLKAIDKEYLENRIQDISASDSEFKIEM